MKLATSGICKAIERAFIKAKKKNWDCIYMLVDVHETIVKPNSIALNFIVHTICIIANIDMMIDKKAIS